MSYQLDGPRPPAGRSHSRYLGACPYGVASRSGTRDPRIGWRSGHAHVDPPFVSFRSTTKNACERSKEQISHRKARRMPRPARRGCAERCSTFALVAGGCEPSSCTYEWCACTRGCPVSGVHPVCVQHRRRRSFVAISLIKAIVSAATDLAYEKPSWTCVSNTGGRAPAALASLVSGCTMRRAWFHVRTNLAQSTGTIRSVFVHAGRFTWRLRMISC